MAPPARIAIIGSGYAVVDSKDPFKAKNTYIYGAFVVPVAQPAFGACNSVSMSSWVGIDGFNSNDVFQAGIEADANRVPTIR